MWAPSLDKFYLSVEIKLEEGVLRFDFRKKAIANGKAHLNVCLCPFFIKRDPEVIERIGLHKTFQGLSYYKAKVEFLSNLNNVPFGPGKHLQFCDGRVGFAEGGGPGFESFRMRFF
jgi:hypothetical protein